MSLSNRLTVGLFYDYDNAKRRYGTLFHNGRVIEGLFNNDGFLIPSCIRTHLDKFLLNYDPSTSRAINIHKDTFDIRWIDRGGPESYRKYEYYTFFKDLYKHVDDLWDNVYIHHNRDYLTTIKKQNEEIKLLNEKVDKLEKDYKQLMINWTTITQYMKKIDLIEDQLKN
jgi:hypothetical protein